MSATATARKAPAKKAAPAKTTPARPAEVDPAIYAAQMIALADIDVSVNPRTDMDPAALADLAESITQDGLQTPIRVEETGGQPAYRLVYGGRRVEAFRLLGREFIPATVRPAGEPARTAAARLVENLQRVDLSPLDEARALQELVTEHGLKQADVAIMIGRNQGHVSKRLALLKLAPKGQAMVANGLLSLEHAVDIAKLPDPVQASVLTNVQGGTAPEVAVRHARERLDQLKERAALIKRMEKAGTPVIDRAVDRGPIPDDAYRVPASVSDAEWEADPGRLAVVRESCQNWAGGLSRWADRYSTTPLDEEPGEPGSQPAPGDPAVAQPGTVAAPRPPASSGTPERDAEIEAARLDGLAREKAAAEAEAARTARLGELRDFIRMLINGKISPTWEPFLVRLSLITALVGDPDDADGCPAAVSSAGEALDLPVHADLDLQGYETLTAVLGLIESDDAQGTLLRLALGARLLNGLRFIGRYEVQLLVASEVLAFLQSQGLPLTEEEASLAAARTNLLDGLSVMFEMVQDRPGGEDDPSVVDAELPEPVAGDKEPADDEPEAELPELDDATGEPDDFDAPVETFRPDHAADATRPTAAEINAMKRPALIELAGTPAAKAAGVEINPRMTRLQLAAALCKALADPATDIA